MKCKEDSEESWTCLAHMGEGIVNVCQFTAKDLKVVNGKTIMSFKGMGLGQCQDWEEPTESVIEKSLEGNYREDHLFALEQSLQIYKFYQG